MKSERIIEELLTPILLYNVHESIFFNQTTPFKVTEMMNM